MNAVARNLWTLQYPLIELGVNIGRTVTLIRLQSGELVIHSTAPFTPQDVITITKLGHPAYLVDAVNMHDTFTKAGQAAFPGVAYFAPEGFSKVAGISTQPLASPPLTWADELTVLELAGKMEKMREHVMLHRPTRTLIVADLAFRVTKEASLGLRIFAAIALINGKSHETAMPRAAKLTIKDRASFARSLEVMFTWDFERVIVGHGNVVETSRTALMKALNAAGFPC